MDALFARLVAGAFTSAEWNVVIHVGGRRIDHHYFGLYVTCEVRRVFERAGRGSG